MPNDTFSLATAARERAQVRTSKAKAYTVKFRIEGELTIAADDEAEAYRLALLWSDSELAEIANLEMDDPVEVGAVQ